MSHTPTSASRRTRFGRVVAVAAVASLATAGSLLSLTGASAASVSTITAVSPHLVSALTLNQVITVTGTGFDETLITAVTIAGCTTAPTYIVASSTMLVLKTAVDCAAGGGALRVITVTEGGAGSTVSVPATAAQALTFVAAPTIADADSAGFVRPVSTNNTAGSGVAGPFAIQTGVGTSASTKGGTVIRVTSGTNPFTSTTLLPLSASLGGVALTGIVKVGTLAGNYFTGVLGAHAAAATPVLRITNAGVSKSFPYALNSLDTPGTHDFTYDGSTITVAPAFGPTKGLNNIIITGSGFATTLPLLNNDVTVGAGVCTVSAATATSITCAVPAALTPFEGPVNVQVVVTGGTALTSTISSGSTYTYVAK